MSKLTELARTFFGRNSQSESSIIQGLEMEDYGRSAEVYNPDRSRRFVFKIFLNAAIPCLEIDLDVESDQKWRTLMMVGEDLSGESEGYIVEVCGLKEEHYLIGKDFRFSTAEDQRRQDTGGTTRILRNGELVDKEPEMSQMVNILKNEGFLMEDEIPESINVIATLSKFIEHVRNADFSTPELIIGDSYEDLKLLTVSEIWEDFKSKGR